MEIYLGYLVSGLFLIMRCYIQFVSVDLFLLLFRIRPLFLLPVTKLYPDFELIRRSCC